MGGAGHEQHHGFFLSRRAGQHGPRGLDLPLQGWGATSPKSGPPWRRRGAQGPQRGENFSPKTQSTRRGVLCLVCLPGSAGLPSAFSWEAWSLRGKGESRSRADAPGADSDAAASSSSPSPAEVSQLTL